MTYEYWLQQKKYHVNINNRYSISCVEYGGIFLEEVLRRDGLSINMLTELSYQSDLGISLKKNLHYFDKDALIQELINITKWYDTCEQLHETATDYRIKSIQSAMLKYARYYPDHQAAKVFNDMLGFRTLCDNYTDILEMPKQDHIRVADMSNGKAKDDGYRGVHVYFQLSNFHYPVEIQYNTYYDRQINNWLHKYVYKRKYNSSIGYHLRQLYENGEIRNESAFKEVLEHVLFDCKKI